MTGSRPVRLGPRHLALLDVAAGVVVAAAAVIGTAAVSSTAVVAGWVVASLLGLLVAVRRHWPTPALWCGAAVAVTSLLIGLRADVAVVALALAAYPAALAVPPGRPARTPAVLLAAVPVTGLITVPASWPTILIAPAAAPVSGAPSTLLYGWLILAATWVLARTVRARRTYAAEVVMLREREAATGERLRIAREVHDVVGHSLGLISARAGIANHLADTHPDEGRAALTSIETISREALAEVRAVLSALHDPADVPAASIGRLVAGARAAGVPVDLACPDLAAVPAAVLDSAHRIVQEALTNVLRHTRGPARCRVAVAIEDAALSVSIVDDGPARSPDAPPGHGLRGVRDRVHRHRGSVSLGPRADGGFEVRALLPYDPALPRG